MKNAGRRAQSAEENAGPLPPGVVSAVIPTLIAQRFFLPSMHAVETTEEDIEEMTPPSGTAITNER